MTVLDGSEWRRAARRYPVRDLRDHALMGTLTYAPMVTVDVIRLDKQGKSATWSRCAGAHAGLVEKIDQGVPATFNAPAESVAEQPMFHTAFKERVMAPRAMFCTGALWWRLCAISPPAEGMIHGFHVAGDNHWRPTVQRQKIGRAREGRGSGASTSRRSAPSREFRAANSTTSTLAARAPFHSTRCKAHGVSCLRVCDGIFPELACLLPVFSSC
jgi:hypothetical protein